jgi:formate dehydrogenase subunit delta
MAREKLAYMANQIGKFFAHQQEEQAVASINDHLRKFWDPRMRNQIVDDLDTAELDPRVRRAVERLKDSARGRRFLRCGPAPRAPA